MVYDFLHPPPPPPPLSRPSSKPTAQVVTLRTQQLRHPRCVPTCLPACLPVYTVGVRGGVLFQCGCVRDFICMYVCIYAVFLDIQVRKRCGQKGRGGWKLFVQTSRRRRRLWMKFCLCVDTSPNLTFPAARAIVPIIGVGVYRCSS